MPVVQLFEYDFSKDEERRQGRNYYYTMTDLGRQFHRFLKNGNIIKLFSRVSGRRLK